MSVILEFLKNDTESSEGMFRGLVVLGTLIYKSDELKRQAILMEVCTMTDKLFGVAEFKERIESVKRELRFVIEN